MYNPCDDAVMDTVKDHIDTVSFGPILAEFWSIMEILKSC